MCEVAVCKGDVGGHARACSRVSRCECESNGEQSGRRNTQVCVGRMEFERENAKETTTATFERQGRVAAVVSLGTVPGWHSSERAVRAVQRTGPPRARLRE